jgi:hypothetical protein
MVGSNVLSGASLRSAARAGRIGLSSLVYTAPNNRPAANPDAVLNGVESFVESVRAVVSQSTDMGTFNQVDHKSMEMLKGPDACPMHVVVLVAMVELGDGFEEEMSEERKEEVLCCVDANNGDILLPVSGTAAQVRPS